MNTYPVDYDHKIIDYETAGWLLVCDTAVTEGILTEEEVDQCEFGPEGDEMETEAVFGLREKGWTIKNFDD